MSTGRPILISVIPEGLTSHLQPADVSWNKPFKTAYKEKYSRWMATGPKIYTAAGNVCPPSKALCFQWVKECWEAPSAEIVQKSFRTCGISVNTDGAEDDEIHCLKEGEVAADAVISQHKESALDHYDSFFRMSHTHEHYLYIMV